MNALISDQNYPNPASDYTYIKVTEAAANGTIEIYSLNGKLAMQQGLGNTILNRVDLSNLPSGMYSYRIVSGNKVSAARKLTIIR